MTTQRAWAYDTSAQSATAQLEVPRDHRSPDAESWELPDAIWQGVSWSLAYVAFLWYMAVVTTYHVAGASLAMIAALIGLATQREPLRVPALLGWFGGFIVWAAIAYPLTRYPETVQQQVTVLAKLWLILLVAVNVLRTRSQLRFFIVFFLACYALYPLRGAFINYFMGYSLLGRAVWNFIYVNPNDLAALTLLQLSMAVGLLATERPKSWVWMAALAGAALLPLLVLMTQSRGGVIALGVFLILLTVSRRRRPVVLIGAAALALGVAMLAPEGVWQRMRGLSKVSSTADLRKADPEGSANARFGIWRVAARIIRDQPVLGVGAGAYGHAHVSYAREHGAELAVRKARDTHSTVLTVLAETGVPGVILFLGLLLTTVWNAERIRRACRATLPRQSTQLLYLEFGLVAFLVAGVFASFGHLAFLYIHLALVWSLAEACRQDAARLRRPPHWSRS